MIGLRRIDHVALRVADVDEAAPRWAIQFGLTERSREDGRALLSCDDEPYALELIEGGQPGHDHTGFELRRSCTLDDAKRHLDAHGVAFEEREGCLFLADPDGNGVQLMPLPGALARAAPDPARPAHHDAAGRSSAQARARQLPHGRVRRGRRVLHRRPRACG